MCCENHCLKVCVKCCEESILIRANLAPLTDYNWIVTDSRGNITTVEFTSDAEGNGTLLASELPDSLFSLVTDHIKIQVKEDLNDDQFVPLRITQTFDCIDIKFNGTKEEIGVDLT